MVNFSPGELDVDESFEPELQDSGMLLFRNTIPFEGAVRGCYEQVTAERFYIDDVFVLTEAKEE